MTSLSKKYLYLTALGASLGERKRNIIQTLKLLQREGALVHRCSSLYETSPAGGIAENTFYNMCAGILSNLEPHDFMQTCLHLEIEIGRRRNQKWEDRIIDIDVIGVYPVAHKEDKGLATSLSPLEIETKILTSPHPLAAERDFVVVPSAEIYPHLKLSENLGTFAHIKDSKKFSPLNNIEKNLLKFIT